jgi:hypothetical protein
LTRTPSGIPQPLRCRSVDLFDFDIRMARTLRAMPAGVRAELLRILELPEAERASAIGDLHRSGVAPNLAEPPHRPGRGRGRPGKMIRVELLKRLAREEIPPYVPGRKWRPGPLSPAASLL